MHNSQPTDTTGPVVGRFAPSPSGRMHLGNVYAALMSWLSARSAGGRWLLRIEDLDRQRSRPEYARLIEDDLRWLGLDWDCGGYDGVGPDGEPWRQSLRGHIYERYFEQLRQRGLLYGCRCTRADLMAASAPHASDGMRAYAGTCRPAPAPPYPTDMAPGAVRLFVDDADIAFADGLYGPQTINPARYCGDIVVRRADGCWAYQLAVVIDDALMGVTEVVRGCDLLASTAPQIYLYRLLGWQPPRFAHIPLLCNAEGKRLSKRDHALSMAELRQAYSAPQIIGRLAFAAGLTRSEAPITPAQLAERFAWQRLAPQNAIIV